MEGVGVFVTLSALLKWAWRYPGLCGPSSEAGHLPLLTPTPSEACLVNPYLLECQFCFWFFPSLRGKLHLS